MSPRSVKQGLSSSSDNVTCMAMSGTSSGEGTGNLTRVPCDPTPAGEAGVTLRTRGTCTSVDMLAAVNDKVMESSVGKMTCMSVLLRHLWRVGLIDSVRRRLQCVACSCERDASTITVLRGVSRSHLEMPLTMLEVLSNSLANKEPLDVPHLFEVAAHSSLLVDSEPGNISQTSSERSEVKQTRPVAPSPARIRERSHGHVTASSSSRGTMPEIEEVENYNNTTMHWWSHESLEEYDTDGSVGTSEDRKVDNDVENVLRGNGGGSIPLDLMGVSGSYSDIGSVTPGADSEARLSESPVPSRNGSPRDRQLTKKRRGSIDKFSIVAKASFSSQGSFSDSFLSTDDEIGEVNCISISKELVNDIGPCGIGESSANGDIFNQRTNITQKLEINHDSIAKDVSNTKLTAVKLREFTKRISDSHSTVTRDSSKVMYNNLSNMRRNLAADYKAFGSSSVRPISVQSELIDRTSFRPAATWSYKPEARVPHKLADLPPVHRPPIKEAFVVSVLDCNKPTLFSPRTLPSKASYSTDKAKTGPQIVSNATSLRTIVPGSRHLLNHQKSGGVFSSRKTTGTMKLEQEARNRKKMRLSEKQKLKGSRVDLNEGTARPLRSQTPVIVSQHR